MPRMPRSTYSARLAPLTFLLPLILAQPAHGDELRLPLPSAASPLPAARVKYSMNISGQVMTPSPAGVQKFDLKSNGRFEFQQQRVTAAEAGSGFIAGQRQFLSAGTETVVGEGHRTAVSLSPDRRQIRVYGSSNQLQSYCATSPLTRNELDLIQMPFDPLAVRAVLPVTKVAVGEKWNTDSWVMPMLTGIETAIDQKATCTLKSADQATAVVQFSGSIKGAVRGSAASVTYSGELTLDRQTGLIKSFKGQQKEKRTAGPVSPGLDITANISWQQSPDATYRPAVVRNVVASPAESLLQFETTQGLTLRHSREWHLFHQTGSVTMLRQLRNGELISQCNITTHLTVPPRQHTPDREFLNDVAAAIQKRSGEVLDEQTIRDDDQWRIRRIRTKGKADEDVILWDHYLCSAASGQQFTILFSHSQSDKDQFATEADDLLSTLQLRSRRSQ
ncbi:MAG: hypothetical protein NXI04_08555 [Planctomycetaceae bacterium]|nr:hypothetical protein [Planctomycetaceae bacterium]